jgi:hypothetical protein
MTVHTIVWHPPMCFVVCMLAAMMSGSPGGLARSESVSRGDVAARKESSMERMRAGRVGVDDFELLKVCSEAYSGWFTWLPFLAAGVIK